MKLFLTAFGCSALGCLAIASDATSQPVPRDVTFSAADRQLHGFLHEPTGKGPFPAVQWNHGSEKLPGNRSDLAAFYVAHGFVFFVPHRHGHGRSPGDYIVDLQTQAKSELKDPTAVHQRLIELHELYLKDTLAAVAWLSRQSFVDTNRIFMSGVSYGGIQTLLAAETNHAICGYVPFAPAAMSWAGIPELHERLLIAIRGAQKPIYLLQASNDYNLGPSQTLGPALQKKGGLNRSGIYPNFGTTPQEGHGAFACRGTNIWGEDVLKFLDACEKK